MRVFAPAPFRWNSTDYPYGWQDFPDATADAMIASGVVFPQSPTAPSGTTGMNRNIADNSLPAQEAEAVRNAVGGVKTFSTRNVAQRGRQCEAKSGSNIQMSGCAKLIFPFAQKSVSLRFPTYYVPSTGVETNAGGTTTLRASVKSPSGVFTRLTFSGSDSITVTDGAMITADPIDVVAGTYEVWTWRNCTGKIIYYTNSQFLTGEGSNFGATVTDLTDAGGTINANGIIYGPIDALANSNVPSVLLFGSSSTAGVQDTSTGDGHYGILARCVGSAGLPYTLASAPSTLLSQFAGSYSNRVALGAYHQHVVMAYGNNDIFLGSRTAAQLLADTITAVSLYSAQGCKCWPTTLGPQSTSTDSFATTANQTTAAQNSVRVTYNDYVRAGSVSGAAGYFEIADVLESARDSGLWKAPSYTADGTHPLVRANLAIAAYESIRTRFLN